MFDKVLVHRMDNVKIEAGREQLDSQQIGG